MTTQQEIDHNEEEALQLALGNDAEINELWDQVIEILKTKGLADPEIAYLMDRKAARVAQIKHKYRNTW